MLHKCANPVCASLFRSLSHGKLFLLHTDRPTPRTSGITPPIRRERSVRRMERYWLCDACSCLVTLTFERGRGMVAVPLPARNTSAPAVHLRQVLHTSKGYRAELKGAV
jgi:hypothetical protein